MASFIPSAPIAKAPYGSLDEPDMLLSSETRSDSSLWVQLCIETIANEDGNVAHRSTENTRAIRPTARILLLTILRRSTASAGGDVGGMTTDSSSELSMSSSCEHVFSTAQSISVTYIEGSRQLTRPQRTVIIRECALFSPTNGRLQVNASIKLGSQYGCGVQLNCRMFSTFDSYLRIAALLLYTSR